MITLQEIINKQYEIGITDLELNIIRKNDIEIGYFSFNPVVTIKIVNNKIVYLIASKPTQPSNFIFAPEEKRVAVFEHIKWLHELRKNETFIDCKNASKVYNVLRIFRKHKNGGYITQQDIDKQDKKLEHL